METKDEKDARIQAEIDAENAALEKDEPEFLNLDDAVNFFRGEIDKLKELAQEDKEKRETPDDFKLYHQQTENRLNEFNEIIEGFERTIKILVDKLQHTGNSYTFNKLWDFLWKG